MARMRKLKYGNDNLAVSSFVSDGIRVFVNATRSGEDTVYSWEIVDHGTDEIIFKQPFTANPVFAYSVEKYRNMDVVARVKGEEVLSCKVFEADMRELPEIKMMYARRSNFFRFTNVTNVENVVFSWQVQTKTDGGWEDLHTSVNKDTNIFEYTFDSGRDYRVTACISSADGASNTRLVTEITAYDLEKPRVI